MVDQHQAQVENTRDQGCYGGTTRGMLERARRNWGCRDRSTLFCVGDFFAPGDTRRTIQYDGPHGDQGAGQWFSVRTRKEPRWTSFRLVFDGMTEPQVKS